MNDLIKKLFQSLQEKMLADLHMTGVMSHPGDKGESTELNWKNLLENHLPKRYSVTKGKVVDYLGNESEQIDIIVYDRQYSPLVFNYNGVEYIPAESVYAVFEVKQNLSKDHIDYAIKKAESVRKLERTSAPIVYSTGLKPPKELHKILAGLLTTRSDWNTDLANHLEQNLLNKAQNQELDLICALEVISCRVSYKHGENKPEITLDAKAGNEVLMHLFLTMLQMLQIIGTVPAIEYDKYFHGVSSIESIYNGEI